MVNFIDGFKSIIPYQYFFINDEMAKAILTIYLDEVEKALNESSLGDKQKLLKSVNSFKKVLSKVYNFDIATNLIKYDFIVNVNFNDIFQKTISEVFSIENISLDANNFEEYLYLTYNFSNGLYLKHGFVPIVNGETSLIPLTKDYTIDDFYKHCLETDIFSDAVSKDDIKEIYENLVWDDEINLDRFLYCAEDLLNINIVLISNKFQHCDKCNKYMFTSILGNRSIKEGIPVYFVYRHISENNTMNFYSIKFLDLNELKIVDELVDFSFARLINKYNENNEIIELKKIEHEPSDINKELPIIEIQLDDQTFQLFVGVNYNLYSMKKDLVGKLDIVSVSGNNGIANIEWIVKDPKKVL
jgi:hypothetical protein